MHVYHTHIYVYMCSKNNIEEIISLKGKGDIGEFKGSDVNALVMYVREDRDENMMVSLIVNN